MSIKLLARDLYRAQQTVDRLEKALETAREAYKAEIEESLRRARAERDRLRQFLDGQIGR